MSSHVAVSTSNYTSIAHVIVPSPLERIKSKLTIERLTVRAVGESHYPKVHNRLIPSCIEKERTVIASEIRHCKRSLR
jgi:hypothetical protein